MQSNQTKLLIAGIVATQVNCTNIESPEDLVPVEFQDGVKNLLAQINQDEPNAFRIPIPPPPSNTNTDTTSELLHDALAENSAFDTENLSDKIGLVVEAAIGGLTAKKTFWLEKLDMYASERLLQFRQVDESCRDKVDAAAQRSIEIMTEASEKAYTEAKQCRKNYIDKLLNRKEEMAGDMQNILNETIQRIKELKVGEKLNEAGMPTGEHSTILEQRITDEIEDFELLMADYIDDHYLEY